MPHETSTACAPSRSVFPDTLWTLVLVAGGRGQGQRDERSAAALAELAARYRFAVHRWFLGAGVATDQAEDLAHDFLAELLRGRILEGFERTQTRFRGFLTVCLRNYVRDRKRSQSAQKRGGGATMLELHPELADGNWPAASARLDESFALRTHERAREALFAAWSNRGQQQRFDVLYPFVFRSPVNGEYEAAAQRLGLKIGALKKAVFDLREAYYDALRAEIAQTTRPEELEEELRYIITLLGRMIG